MAPAAAFAAVQGLAAVAPLSAVATNKVGFWVLYQSWKFESFSCSVHCVLEYICMHLLHTTCNLKVRSFREFSLCCGSKEVFFRCAKFVCVISAQP